MKHVRIRITADGHEDEVHPIYDLLANAPFVGYATAIQWNFTDDELGMLHYVEGDQAAFADALDSIPEALGFEMESAGEEKFYAYVRGSTTAPIRELWEVTARRALVTVPPVEYHEDGTVTLAMFGPGEVIQNAIETVPDPITVTVEEISGLQALPQTVASSLTDRQREAVEAAVAVGYYDVPRTGSQDDVARRLDCSPSTAAEHLQKAEATVIRSLFGG